MYVSLESLHSQGDSITYVFKKEGLNVVKQEVQIGETNSNDAIVLTGLSLEDKVYLSIPSGLEGQTVNLLPELNGKRKKKPEDVVAKDTTAISQSTIK